MTPFIPFTTINHEGEDMPIYIRGASIDCITDSTREGYCQIILSGFGAIDIKGTRQGTFEAILHYSR